MTALPAQPTIIQSADPRCPDQYLKSYEPEAHDGRGYCEWTDDLAEAIIYPTAIDAFQEWLKVPVSRPLRDDGMPNRPLTTFTVTFIDAPEVTP